MKTQAQIEGAVSVPTRSHHPDGAPEIGAA